jgi:hypothetical protein
VILHLRVCKNHLSALWVLTNSISDENACNLGVLLGQRRTPGCSPTRPIFHPFPGGNGCQLRRGSRVEQCVFVPLLTSFALDQGLHFLESIYDRNEALETGVFIGRNFPALCSDS